MADFARMHAKSKKITSKQVASKRLKHALHVIAASFWEFKTVLLHLLQFTLRHHMSALTMKHLGKIAKSCLLPTAVSRVAATSRGGCEGRSRGAAGGWLMSQHTT
eukprot:2488415-Amphidinium_carterae.1